MKAITNRQRDVLNYINLFIADNQFSPSVRDISRHLDISVRAGYQHLKALGSKGYITQEHNKPRTIRVSNIPDRLSQEFIEVPLLGNVAAGSPLFSEENLSGTIKISSQLISDGDYFAMHVQGHSMEGVGIMDGDIAILRRQIEAHNGQIVMVVLDEAITIKRFFHEKNRIRLQAENPTFNDIYAREVRIVGLLTQIIRLYE